MGLGCRNSGRTEGRSAKVLIRPVGVKWLHPRNESWKNIKNRNQSLSLATASDNKKMWSDDDLQKLYALDHLPALEVAGILKRSLWSVQHKRRKKVRQKVGEK